MAKSIKTIFVSLAVGAAILANPTPTASETTHESPLTISVPDQLDIFIERLAFQESSGRETIDIIDTNGKHSRGCLQYQDETFARFTKKYQLEGDVFDCTFAKKLTRQILLHERNGWTHWRLSVTRLGGKEALPLPVVQRTDAGSQVR